MLPLVLLFLFYLALKGNIGTYSGFASGSGSTAQSNPTSSGGTPSTAANPSPNRYNSGSPFDWLARQFGFGNFGH